MYRVLRVVATTYLLSHFLWSTLYNILYKKTSEQSKILQIVLNFWINATKFFLLLFCHIFGKYKIIYYFLNLRNHWKYWFYIFLSKNVKKRESIDITAFSRFLYGGDTRIWTGDQSFADSCLTTWLCRHMYLERKTGLEPATSTLARLHSTNWATFA